MPDRAKSFTVADDGKSITCLFCNRTSCNAKDVAERFCGNCNVFHDDIWMASEFLEEIREVFRRIANEEQGCERGHFLTYFAKALLQADPENFVLLTGPAVQLILKYKLMECNPPAGPGAMANQKAA